MKPDQKLCSDCLKPRDRCRAVTVNLRGEVEYICPRCWRELNYDTYLYKHRQPGYSESTEIANHRNRLKGEGA